MLTSLLLLDTRTTQWEDPRLNNPKIAGPVSLILNLILLYILCFNKFKFFISGITLL